MTEIASKRWFAVDILADAAAAEAVESAFNLLESIGTEINGLRKSADAPQLVTGFFDTLPADDEIQNAVNEALQNYALEPGQAKLNGKRQIDEADWLAEWKKHWKPTEIGRFVIAPPWEDVETAGKIIIRIEPNMAFGTGTHETTQLCLKALSEIYSPDWSFLDVGTGTGILAIAAAKLAKEDTDRKNISVPSVAKILACDTDADSVKIAHANASANGVGDKIEFFHGSVDDKTPSFDLVCANLTIDVILPILPLLIAKSRSTLLLSGILAEQEHLIADALRKSQIANFKVETAGEWISVIVDLRFRNR